MVDPQDTNSTPPIEGLEQLLREASNDALPPVERWNPPYCGDIGLAIQADGTWLYRGSPISRPALVKLFSRVLRRDEDGRTYLVTPAEKVDVRVEDAPFLAVEMAVRGEGEAAELVFRTNVDDVVVCGRDHPLRFDIESPSGSVKPYLRVRGRLDALLTRSLTYDLLQLAARREPPGILSGGEVFEIASHLEG